MRVLCVAEKPSIAKSISGILSGGRFNTENTGVPWIKNYEFDYPQTNDHFVVTALTGHLFVHDFPDQYRQWNSCDPFILFDAPVELKVASDKTGIATNLKNLARRCQKLVIWTDCDREGENIGSEIVTVCRQTNPRILVKRARFSAIIPAQIHRAAQNPIELDMAQAAAVDARSLLDLRLGAAFTRMQCLALQRSLPQLNESMMSYGPCQFPTLGFVVSRYEQVKAFVPEPFWYIYLSLKRRMNGENNEVEFSWKRGRLFEFDVAVALYEYVLESPMATVTRVNKKTTKKWKPLPLTTVEMQKAGSRLLRMTPKKILDTAEKLYQSGFLSYPRTETDQFDPAFDHMALIEKQTVDGAWGGFATSLQQGGFGPPRKGKKNDQAHPPIHPTAHAGNLTGDEKRVYEYVTRRYLASCSKDAEGFETTIEVVAGGEEFSTTGLEVLARYYLEVYPYDKWNGKELPEFRQGEEFMPSVCELRDGQTSKPNLLTEADLVALMDKNGIGTDATIAQHIDTIISREYVYARKEGSVTYLVPSTLGVGLIEGYNRIGFERSLSKPQLRRETERRMVDVCEGTKSKHQMLEESIEQYKHVFMLARSHFNHIVDSVRRRISGNNGPNDRADDQHAGDGGGPGGEEVVVEVEEVVVDLREVEVVAMDLEVVVEVDEVDEVEHLRDAAKTVSTAIQEDIAACDSVLFNLDSDDGEDPPAPPNPPSRRPPPQSTAPIVPLTTGNASISGVQCRCGVQAVERTVTRESQNKGRKFWKCGNGDACDFFEWFDGPSGKSDGGIGDMNKSIPAKRNASSALNSAVPTKRCKCDLTAVSRTVMKEGPTQGKMFWTCPNSQNARCGFFEWDEPSVPAGSQSQKPSGGSSSNCFKCGQEGHYANACPSTTTGAKSSAPSQVAGGSNIGSCFKCGEEGHFANACTSSNASTSRYANNSGTTGSKSGECFKCGQSGHWSSECTGASSSFGGTGGRGRGKSTGTSSKPKRGGSSGSTRGRGTTRKASGSKRKKATFSAADDW
ncbi:DNA topoisomerase [Tulasnella sp. 419]|nr:DNA topoisomerase [Tulasnella sp. 419]